MPNILKISNIPIFLALNNLVNVSYIHYICKAITNIVEKNYTKVILAQRLTKFKTIKSHVKNHKIALIHDAFLKNE